MSKNGRRFMTTGDAMQSAKPVTPNVQTPAVERNKPDSIDEVVNYNPYADNSDVEAVWKGYTGTGQAMTDPSVNRVNLSEGYTPNSDRRK